MAVTDRTLNLLLQLRVDVGDTADTAVREITDAWVTTWDTLEQAWRDAIADVLAVVAETGVWPPPWRLARIARRG